MLPSHDPYSVSTKTRSSGSGGSVISACSSLPGCLGLVGPLRRIHAFVVSPNRTLRTTRLMGGLLDCDVRQGTRLDAMEGKQRSGSASCGTIPLVTGESTGK